MGHNFYDIMKEEMVVVEEESIVARAVRNYVFNHGDDLSRVHAWKKVYEKKEQVSTRPAANKRNWW